MSGPVTNFLTKAFSPAYYQQQFSNVVKSAYNYYHPLFRSGSVTPLWHCMLLTATVMYTVNYSARDYPHIQHKRHMQKEALKEYYEKHGIEPEEH